MYCVAPCLGIQRWSGVNRDREKDEERGRAMHLTPREVDKLLIFVAAEVARRRRERGLQLNYPEAIALISAELLEGARDGKSVAELMRYGGQILRRDEVMEGVPEMLAEVQIQHNSPP